jgi:hypothetical protein
MLSYACPATVGLVADGKIELKGCQSLALIPMILLVSFVPAKYAADFKKIYYK